MAALHIVNRPCALASCLEVAADADTILLIEDGVYAAAVTPGRTMRALRDDVLARGLAERLAADVELADYDDFVGLVERHQPIVSWA